jgi:hypothetical protein
MGPRCTRQSLHTNSFGGTFAHANAAIDTRITVNFGFTVVHLYGLAGTRLKARLTACAFGIIHTCRHIKTLSTKIYSFEKLGQYEILPLFTTDFCKIYNNIRWRAGSWSAFNGTLGLEQLFKNVGRVRFFWCGLWRLIRFG